MPDPSPFADERQPTLFDDLPIPPPRSSDARARADIMAMVELLEAAKAPPWSLRLLGWRRRRVATLSLTPVVAAALTARFAAELDRLGSPED